MKKRRVIRLFPVLLTMALTAAGCGESAPAAVSETAGSEEAGVEEISAESFPDEDRDEETGTGDSQGLSADTVTGYQDLEETDTKELQYATEFRITSLCNGRSEVSDDSVQNTYRLITIPEDDQQFLLVPEGQQVPENIPAGITVLQQPLDRTYLAASDVMDDLNTIGVLDDVRFSGIKEENWSIPEAQEAMDLGYIVYAGKYNEPDYELLLGEDCGFAIENTMIYHNPEVKEKLEELGIPVLVERSSYERNPLGRLEWIRLYGVLYGKEEEADTWYQNELDSLQPILEENRGDTGKTVAFFSVTSNGSVTVRKPGDYISKLIEMAGGQYVIPASGDEDDNALSTMNMQMEEFYAEAKDADILIYNSTIEGEISSVQDLLDKSELFADFKAVRTGDVYCTGQNLYQQPTGIGELLKEMHTIFAGEETADLKYLTKVGDK